MSVEILSVFDQAAVRYMDPFPAPTIEFAIRGFKEACTTKDHQFMKYPEDYVLYHVGTFDEENGLIEGLVARKVAAATSFVHAGQLDLVTELESEA